jgi:RES domain-containing protein
LSLCRPFAQTVYRFHNPKWAFEPLSGAGATKYGGRFNPSGTPALYTSLDIPTAVIEANQGLASKIRPLTLCSYEVEYDAILDLTSVQIRRQLGISMDDLACPWRLDIARGNTPKSWSLACDLMASNIPGMIVQSFAHDATADNINLVLWHWSDRTPTCITAYDPQGHLPKNQDSWTSPLDRKTEY